MAKVHGYVEDEVDLLTDDFARVVDKSLSTAVAAAVNVALEPIVAAARVHAFHLPGKHDQATHGRSRTREVKVLDSYGDWGGQGKRPWMASSDPDVRANNLWSDSFEGQQAIVATMRNAHAGQVDPTYGVDTSSGPLGEHAKVFNYDDPTGTRYGADQVRNDVYNAAMRMDERLEMPDEFNQELYRGMRVEGAAEKFKVGEQFDSDISSWTPNSSAAKHYTTPQVGSGRPDGGQPVIMRLSGTSHGINLDDGSLNQTAGSGEHLLRGSFKITNVSMRADDVMIVDVEQLWLPG